MSKQNRWQLYGVAAVLLVVLMAGAYILGGLSNTQTLAAQTTATPAADDHQQGSMQDLTEQWETMQSHRQQGMDMPMAERMQ